jgi:non-specific serine/threonine protein kinase
MRMACLIARFWDVHGHWSEGRAWLERALDRSADATPERRARVLAWTGVIANLQSESAAARSAFEESIAILDACGAEKKYRMGVLSGLAGVLLDTGEHDAALPLYEQLLAYNREQGSPLGLSVALDNLAIIAMGRGDYERAEALAAEGLETARAGAVARMFMQTMQTLGALARERGEIDRAEAFYVDSLAHARDVDHRLFIMGAKNGLASVALARGDVEGARRLLDESLEIGRKIGDHAYSIEATEWLARVALAAGEPAETLRLLSEVDAERRRLSMKRPPAEQAAIDALEAEARA